MARKPVNNAAETGEQPELTAEEKLEAARLRVVERDKRMIGKELSRVRGMLSMAQTACASGDFEKTHQALILAVGAAQAAIAVVHVALPAPTAD